MKIFSNRGLGCAPGRGGAASGLFDAGKQTFGSADELTYDDTTRQATYRTAAQLVQGAGADLTRIQADVIQIGRAHV